MGLVKVVRPFPHLYYPGFAMVTQAPVVVHLQPE